MVCVQYILELVHPLMFNDDPGFRVVIAPEKFLEESPYAGLSAGDNSVVIGGSVQGRILSLAITTF
jgi:hypothetical protein